VGLNIKNLEAETKIRELAAIRGVSLVAAVLQATEKDLEREKATPSRKRLMSNWLMEISRETGPMMDDGKNSIELIAELYDPQTGLPI
jgi:hypothetical protein